MSFETRNLEALAAPIKNAIAGGPFGSNLVSKDYAEFGIPVIRGQNMGEKWVQGDFVFVSPEKAESLAQNKARPGDLVFTQRGTLGQVSIVPKTPYTEYIVSQSQMKITLDPQKADVNFIYYLFKTEEQLKYIFNSAIQTGVPHTNLGILRKTPVVIPPLDKQRSIASMLSLLDDRITLLRETNATLEAIAQALFKSWFVDFDPVRAKQQGQMPEGMDEATAALFPDGFDESQFGMVPKTWRVGKLADICSISSGKRPSDRSDKLTETFSVPLYGGAGPIGYTSTSLFDEPRIVTGRVGTLGKVHIAYPPFWASDNVLVLTPLEPAAFTFCLHWTRSIDVSTLNRGSTQPLLTQRDLGAELGIIPPIEILTKFEAVVSPLYEQIHAQSERAEHIASLRNTLLPRLISGKLHLPENAS